MYDLVTNPWRHKPCVRPRQGDRGEDLGNGVEEDESVVWGEEMVVVLL